MSRYPDGSLESVTTVRAMIITPGLDRLFAFYGRLLGAEEVERMPAEGPPFHVGLRLGESDLGLVADALLHLRDPDGNAVNLTQDLEPTA